MMRYLIVNADDFGLATGVTDGILEAHVSGIVTSTSMMVCRTDAERAGQLAREHPELAVGLHFDEPDGVDLNDPGQAERALAKQLDRFRQLTGADPTHLDSHHHAHLTRDRPATFRRLAKPLGIPVRRDGGIGYIGGFYGQWAEGVTDTRHISRESLLELVANEAGEGFTELACHPARLTDDLRSSYLEERAVELSTLTSPGLRQEIEALGVELVSFRDWRSIAA